MSKAPKYQWQPTTAEIARRAGIAVRDVVRFDHNTSPFGTDWTMELMTDAARRLNEYPGADYRPLREAAARRHGLRPEWVAVGAGADELILLAAKAFLGSGKRAVATTPTYPLYRIASMQHGARFEEVPRSGPSFELPTAEVAGAAATADVVWLCTPHNPTGTRAATADVLHVVGSAAGLVVVDAAYAEFAGDEWSDAVRHNPNLVALHTMSKAFGLAGLRVGYALAHPEVVAEFDQVRPPGSISLPSAEVAAAALGDVDRMERTVAALVEARDKLAIRLEALGLRPLASHANFVLCELPDRAPAPSDLADRLMDEGIVIRTFPPGRALDRHVRFTVRTATEHARLIDALRRRL